MKQIFAKPYHIFVVTPLMTYIDPACQKDVFGIGSAVKVVLEGFHTRFR